MGKVAGGSIETWVDLQGEGHLYTYVPITFGGHRVGAIELSEPLTAEKAYIRSSMVRLLVTTGGMALAAGMIALGFGALIVGRPIRALAERARRIGWRQGAAVCGLASDAFPGAEVRVLPDLAGRDRVVTVELGSGRWGGAGR